MTFSKVASDKAKIYDMEPGQLFLVPDGDVMMVLTTRDSLKAKSPPPEHLWVACLKNGNLYALGYDYQGEPVIVKGDVRLERGIG